MMMTGPVPFVTRSKQGRHRQGLRCKATFVPTAFNLTKGISLPHTKYYGPFVPLTYDAPVKDSLQDRDGVDGKALGQ